LFGADLDNFWDYIVFDLELGIGSYTQEYIYNKLDIDEVIKKWVMLKNNQHIKAQLEARNIFYTHSDGKNKFEWQDVPFKLAKEEMPFDREKAWEDAPIYDFGSDIFSLREIKK
jgi:hypothetical protein